MVSGVAILRNINSITFYLFRVESSNKTRDIAVDITVIEASLGSFKLKLADADVCVPYESHNYEIDYRIQSQTG